MGHHAQPAGEYEVTVAVEVGARHHRLLRPVQAKVADAGHLGQRGIGQPFEQGHPAQAAQRRQFEFGGGHCFARPRRSTVRRSAS